LSAAEEHWPRSKSPGLTEPVFNPGVFRTGITSGGIRRTAMNMGFTF
jgi:hypothetical protein